jgi:hypothetical protein
MNQVKTVWDHESRKFIEVESISFTGRGATLSLVPERSERTNETYDQEELDGVCLKYLDRRMPRNCLCGCGLATRKGANGMYRVYAKGHKAQSQFNRSSTPKLSASAA